MQNAHMVDSLSRRIQLGVIREDLGDWVSETFCKKSKLTCLAAPQAVVAAAAALVPAARGQSIT